MSGHSRTLARASELSRGTNPQTRHRISGGATARVPARPQPVAPGRTNVRCSRDQCCLLKGASEGTDENLDAAQSILATMSIGRSLFVAIGSDASRDQLAGACECGAVRYEVEDAFLYAANCHCSRCRASTGTAFKAFAGIERGKLIVTAGEGTLLVVGEPDANHTRCAVCGSLLFSVVRDGAFVHVAMGSPWTHLRSGRPSTSTSPRRHRGSKSPTACHTPGARLATAPEF